MKAFLRRWWPMILYMILVVAIVVILVRHLMENMQR